MSVGFLKTQTSNDTTRIEGGKFHHQRMISKHKGLISMYEDVIYQSGLDPCWIALTWSFGDDNDILVKLYEKVKLKKCYDTLSKVRTLKCQVKSSFFFMLKIIL